MAAVSQTRKALNASECLKNCRHEILQRWESTIQQIVPESRKLSEDVLRNSIPDFLIQLSEVISTAGHTPNRERSTDELIKVCREHGAQRAQIPEYTLELVILEHRLLRRIMFEVFEEQNCEFNRSELTKFLESIDHALVQSATEFASSLGFERARSLEESRKEVDSLKSERALREQFVSVLAHDLRTPLTSIKISSEMLLRMKTIPEPARRFAFKITDGILRMENMIRDLLDANRIRAGQNLPLDIKHIDLAELVRTNVSEAEVRYGKRFKLFTPQNLQGYWGADEIRRMLENLISNAVKYGDPESPIEIRLDDFQNKVRISVRNFGNTILPGDVERLFLPFERGGTAKLKSRGWGIGLTLVRAVCEAHGGTVHLTSTPEQGTIFTAELSRDARQAADAA